MALKMHLEVVVHQPQSLIKNIQATECIVMRKRQIYVRRVANELDISKNSVYEMMNNHLGVSKVCTRTVPKLLTPVQRLFKGMKRSICNFYVQYQHFISFDFRWTKRQEKICFNCESNP